MKKSEHLFALIKSLSSNEKRYFRLFCERESGQSNYLRLFDAIDAQSRYDERAIRHHFRGQKFTDQLHVTKNYLQKIILKSLRNFHADSSKAVRVKDLLHNVDIMFRKELYPQCLVELRKAEAIAEEYEQLTAMIEILTWKRKLRQRMFPHDYASFQVLVHSQADEIARLQNVNDYWMLAVDLSVMRRQVVESEVKQPGLLENVQNAKSLEAAVLHYNSLYLTQLQPDTQDEAELALSDLLALLESKPRRIAEDGALYASTINNLVSFLVFRKKYEKALAFITQAKARYDALAVTAENRILLKEILRTYNIELEVYRDLQTFDKHMSFIDETEGFVMEYRHKMPREYLMSFWFQLAHIHFMRKDYERSLSWINYFLNARFRNIRADLDIQARMLNLMVHFEMQNFFVMRYFVDSTRRFIRKLRPLHSYEKTLLAFFSRISNTPLLEYQEQFESLQKKLFPPGGESQVPPEVLNTLDYRDWIAEH